MLERFTSIRINICKADGPTAEVPLIRESGQCVNAREWRAKLRRIGTSFIGSILSSSPKRVAKGEFSSWLRSKPRAHVTTYKRPFLKSFLLTVLVALAGLPACSHSGAIHTTPENASVLEAVPTTLTLIFSKPFRLTRVQLLHGDAPAVELDLGDQTEFLTQFEVPLIDMGNGLYQIEWRGLANDGHAMNDMLSFEVK